MADTRLDNRLLEPLYAAADWWLTELRDLLRQVLLFNRMKPLRMELTPDDEPLPVGGGSNRIGRGRRNVLLQLDDNRFLYRKIKLPQAAGKNIERVIGYEFNKYFPMQAENALFSCRIVPASAESGSVEVEIWAVSRRQIDLYLAMMRRNLGIEVLTLHIGDGSGQARITHDLERERRRQTTSQNPRFGRLLNLLLAALAAALLAYPVMKMEAYLDAQRDEVSRARRELPRVRIDKDYVFRSERGEETLADLFDGRSQLLVYHFMFGPDWEEGCKSCSLIAEGFDGPDIHLAQRDVTFLAASTSAGRSTATASSGSPAAGVSVPPRGSAAGGSAATRWPARCGRCFR